ncbi:hypothetical protein ASD56_08855 [Microbacterium sp. Root166]|uniref:hypothetical protein n=1 Tax=Microbacterium sp. Root166 TaxID=1736478 RepID=UPI0006F92AB4|nr:hypothetical protein [Microbacterium sp. Root166]KQZ84116.1 hypothetical protein ASD56_08855 [Microbacterium sp. Root166]
MTASVSPGRRIVLLFSIGFGALAALVGVGLYGLVLAPSPSTPTTAVAPTAPAASDVSPKPSASSATLPPIRSTSNAEAFARQAAGALINWDAATDFDPADYAQVVVDAGDPSGAETAGLASDVRTYLPTTEAWITLRTYGTRQWLIIDEAFVPASWNDAIDQATPGQILPGTIAYTVTGTRHRAGIVGTQAQETSRPIAFTLFIACEPSFDECRLLRLSAVDNPLR